MITNHNQLLENTPKKKNNNFFKKSSLVSVLFIIGLIVVSFIKNETRYLEKEIATLQKSIYDHKFNLHQAMLDHDVITSPENISLLANDYLESDFVFYKREQIKNLNNDDVPLPQKKIKKKLSLTKLKKMYSEPEKITKQARANLTNKINTAKRELTYFYNEPVVVIKSERAQRWAAFQIVKVFLGIPIVPGK